jgi:hypothetical protein
VDPSPSSQLGWSAKQVARLTRRLPFGGGKEGCYSTGIGKSLKRNDSWLGAFTWMTIDILNTDPSLVSTPKRVQRERFAAGRHNVVDVGSGTKWNNPVKKSDVMSLMSTERDIAVAVDAGGWKAGSVILYRDWLLEEELDPTELQGKDLSCTCKLSDPCHADVLIELANA